MIEVAREPGRRRSGKASDFPAAEALALPTEGQKMIMRVSSHKTWRRQRGMVTAELAIGILSATMVAVCLAWGINLLAVHTECADAAAQIARAEARGDAPASTQARGHAPSGASISVDQTGSQVVVTVGVPVSFGKLISVGVSGSATMPKEVS